MSGDLISPTGLDHTLTTHYCIALPLRLHLPCLRIYVSHTMTDPVLSWTYVGVYESFV